MFTRTAASAALLLLAPVALAQSEDTPPNYGGVMGSYIVTDNARNADEGYGAHLFYGMPLNSLYAIEASVFGHRFNLENGGDDKGYGFGADAVRRHVYNDRITAFALAGLGGLYEEIGPDDEFSPFANIGAGALFQLNEQLRLRTEARYYATFNDTSYPGEDVIYDVRFNFGFELPFGEPAPVEVVEEPVAPPPPVASIDDDNDGVPNDADACPDTPPGFTVDATGCIVQQTVAFQNIQFDFDSDVLTESSAELLRGIAAGLKSQTDLKVDIAGHTCSLGPQAYNLTLSERRAASVKQFLVGEGIEADRMTAEGFGEFNPIAPNDTEEGRVQNRRVEFKAKVM